MNVLMVSTSLDPASRSWVLAKFCIEELRALGSEPALLNLREQQLPLFDNDKVYGSALVRDVWQTGSLCQEGQQRIRKSMKEANLAKSGDSDFFVICLWPKTCGLRNSRV